MKLTPPGFYCPYVLPKFQDVEKSMLFFCVVVHIKDFMQKTQGYNDTYWTKESVKS